MDQELIVLKLDFHNAEAIEDIHFQIFWCKT